MNEIIYHQINESIQEQNQLDEMLKQVERLEDFYYIEQSVILD